MQEEGKKSGELSDVKESSRHPVCQSAQSALEFCGKVFGFEISEGEIELPSESRLTSRTA